jgi:hypothetical protein
MSRIRDIANLFSGSTDAATDAEVAAAVSAHNSTTTSVHGITNTSVLATSTSVTSAVSTHATAANGHVGRGNTVSRPASPTLGDTYFDTTNWDFGDTFYFTELSTYVMNQLAPDVINFDSSGNRK